MLAAIVRQDCRMLAQRACAACGGRDLHAHLSVKGEIGPEGLIPTTAKFGTALGNIVRCGRCGHMQLHPMPDAAVLAGAYAEAESEDYVEQEAGQRETARRALERIEAHRSRGTLLDIGCWVGFLLAEARDRGWRAFGIEPSDFGSRYARERLGLEVVTGELLSAPLPETEFDAITMGDVIEHLPDPAEALTRVRSRLAHGGVVWLALPDAGSRLARAMGGRWWSVLPTHVQYFTRHSMTALLHRTGFELLELTTAPKVFTVGYYLERIGGYSPALARGLGGAAVRTGVADRVWAPDFRDRMAVIARTV
jgi:SAM-dependent methyltransferase